MKKIFFFLITMLLLFNTACWDRVEINNYSYIMGIGIDEFNDEKANVIAQKDKEENMFNFLFEISNLSGGSDQQANKGGSAKNGSFKITVAANTISQALDALETTIENNATLTHLQALIINDKVAKQGIVQATDFLVRDPRVRRRTNIFISSEETAKIFAIESRMSESVGEYLSELSTNANNTSMVLEESDLGTLTYSLSNGIDFLLPSIHKNKGNIAINGAAIFNSKGEMNGSVGNGEFEGARWLRNLYGRGYVSCDCPITGKTIIVRIAKSKTKVHINKDLSVSVNIKVSGNIATNIGGISVLTEEYLNVINNSVEQAIKRKTDNALYFFQKEVKSDVLFIGLKFKQYKHNIWKEYEKDWNNYFSDINIHVSVDSNIKNVGSITSLIKREE